MTDGVFISYRRDDARHLAGWLAERVSERFRGVTVFRDVDSIPAGEDFKAAIESAISASAVVLAVIGREWAGITDRDGRRRLDAEDDPVAFELATALHRGVRVIPVLVDGARMPAASELPLGLRQVSNLQGVRVDAESFDRDAEFLITAIAPSLPAARRRRTLRRLATAALTLAVLATGGWLVAHAVRSQPSTPIATPIVSVDPQPPASF